MGDDFYLGTDIDMLRAVLLATPARKDDMRVHLRTMRSIVDRRVAEHRDAEAWYSGFKDFVRDCGLFYERYAHAYKAPATALHHSLVTTEQFLSSDLSDAQLQARFDDELDRMQKVLSPSHNGRAELRELSNMRKAMRLDDDVKRKLRGLLREYPSMVRTLNGDVDERFPDECVEALMRFGVPPNMARHALAL
jgi:hypothetical protein